MVPIQNRPLITDHSKQTTFITDPFITDLFKTDHFHHYDLFLLQYCKATTTVNPCTGL